MFRLRRCVIWFCGVLVLASVSQPLFTAVRNRLGKLNDSPTRKSASVTNGKEKSAKAHQLNNDYGKLPIYFEPNLGQTDSQVKFIARGSGATTFLTATETVFALLAVRHSRESGNPDPLLAPIDNEITPRSALGLGLRHPNLGFGALDSRRLRSEFQNPPSAFGYQQSPITMRLVGANPNATVEGLNLLPGISNYFIGNDSSMWRKNIPHYAKVRYREVYPGIDLVYRGHQQSLEYDFVLKPGSNVASIQIAFEGTEDLRLDERGDLRIRAEVAEIRQPKPRIFQMLNGVQREIAGVFALQGSRQVAFQVAQYNPKTSLVIDPKIEFFRSMGGRNVDTGSDIKLDSQGDVYLAGYTNSSDFPTTPGSLQPQLRSGVDNFVVKLSPDGNQVLYSTFIGGTGSDSSGLTIPSIAIDSAGNVFLTSATESTDFPTTPGAYRTTFLGGLCGMFRPTPCSEGVILKLGPAGNELIYSSYFGGGSLEYVTSVGVDAAGQAYAAGTTLSADFPAANGFQSTFGGSADGFITKFNATGTALLYSTFLGGSASEGSLQIVVDSTGSVFVAGTTDSPDFPTRNPLQSTKSISEDWFVTKINPGGNTLAFSSYFGGDEMEANPSIAVDAAGNAYVAGVTRSRNLPTLQAFQPSTAGQIDVFISKWNPSGSALLFATYLGGRGDDYGRTAIAIDPQARIYVAGETQSSDFPLVNPAAISTNTVHNSFLAKLDSTAGQLSYSTLVSTEPTEVSGLAVDPSGNAFLTGGLSYYAPPSTNYTDLFLAKIAGNTPSDPPTFFVPVVLSLSGLNGSFYSTELALTNRSVKDASLELIYTAAYGSGSGNITDSLPAGRQRIIPDAIEYLRSRGLPIPDAGNQGGSLFVRFLGLPRYFDGAVTVRTTTATPQGRAGLAYSGVSTLETLSAPAYICGLRQNRTDRSNIAIQNAGLPGSGQITLRLTLYSGNPSIPLQTVLPEQRLQPGEFRQFTEVLKSSGMSLDHGYVKVERTSGTAPYYAYGVINDQENSDGSFVAPIPASGSVSGGGGELPVVVESDAFSTELMLTNFSQDQKSLLLRYYADAIQTQEKVADFIFHLEAGEQRIVPNYPSYLRSLGVPGIQDPSVAYVGKVVLGVVSPNGSDGLFVGARTITKGTAARYGVSYSTIKPTTSSWLYGLRQDSSNRSNIALASSGVFNIDLFDGDTGKLVRTIEGFSVGLNQWKQIGSILANYAPGIEQGYARVSSVDGSRVVSYAVINDGAAPGERTGDGAFIGSSP